MFELAFPKLDSKKIDLQLSQKKETDTFFRDFVIIFFMRVVAGNMGASS